MSFSRKAWHPVGVLALGAAVALGGCSSILDVKNPNNVAEAALLKPESATAQANGVLAATLRMLSGVTTPYAVATDELDWIGSRDAWNDLETGNISNYLNEFTDGAFPYVGEARFMGDATIGRLKTFDAGGLLTNRADLARTYLYTALVYTTIADMYDDYAFSTKTIPAKPIGRAAMGSLYDSAVVYLDRGLVIANAGTTTAFTSLRYPMLAYRARVKHAKAVWAKITPKSATAPANPLVNDAGAVTDATAAIALGTADQKFTLFDNKEATAGIVIWFEVNGRNESRTGTVYRTLVDPVSGTLDPTVQALLTQFTNFGTQEGTFTLTSTRELRLILAEAALASANIPEFTNQLNQVRALDGKPAWSGTPAAQTMLAYERQAQLWLMRRRLSDMYRFGQKDPKWTTRPGLESSLNFVGLLFPIPNVERLGNPCIADPGSC